MKGKIIGLGVVILAISLSAFVKNPEAKARPGGHYWFPLDGGGLPKSVTSLVYQATDPYGCSAIGFGSYCSGSWTSYSGSGPYSAAGTQWDQDFYLY